MLLIVVLLCWKYVEGSVPIVPGRRPAEADEYPYVVSIIAQNDIHVCGGCLVHQRCVLTAASCVGGYSVYAKTFYPLDLTDFRVAAGSKSQRVYPADSGQEVRYVQRIILHPGLELRRAGHWKNNIGLAFVERPFLGRNVRPLRVPDPFARGRDAELETVGWGRSTVTWNPVGKRFDYSGHSDVLQVLKSNALDEEDCKRWLCTVYAMDDCKGSMKDEFCGVTDVGNTSGVCTGDVGMPVVYNDTLMGVVSWSIPCTSSPKSKYAVSDLHLVYELQELYPFAASSWLRANDFILFTLLTIVTSHF